ncbi:hypothetical protein DPEC_G00097150 [Dallia pectoralis]|uniref:Uncharacterized protein n=1 Tax=Dallia pectoralis TaxID=75939 RepID=A0ACC2GVP5_DALPE|nr:hypothetical protein DPEC_G00097150 [Dallia pectoralis]
MCTGKCSKVIAVSLYVLAGVSILCNIMAFFPGWSTEYAQMDGEGNEPRITDEVKYMGGLIGGGLMCLIPAIHIHLTSSNGCCANRCGMFLSIGFAAAGVVGALYSLSTAALALANGPVCEFGGVWGRPFLNNNGSYLGDTALWTIYGQWTVWMPLWYMWRQRVGNVMIHDDRRLRPFFYQDCLTTTKKGLVKRNEWNHQTAKEVSIMNTTRNCTESDLMFVGVYSIIFTIGLFLNTTALVIFRYSKSRSHTTFYMTHLAIADLLLVLTLPLRIYYHLGYKGLPQLLCNGVAQFLLINMYASIFLLTCICFDRCMAVCFPMSSRVREGRKKAPLVCLGVWLFTIGASFPVYKNIDNKNATSEGSCFSKFPVYATQPLAVSSALIIGFVVPFVVMSVCSWAIVRAISRSSVAQTDLIDSAKIQRLIASSLLIFLTCFLPYHLTLIVFYVKRDTITCPLLLTFRYSLMVACLNAMLDPLVYYFTTETFRKKVDMSAFRRMFPVNSQSRSTGNRGSNESPSHSALPLPDPFTRLTTAERIGPCAMKRAHRRAVGKSGGRSTHTLSCLKNTTSKMGHGGNGPERNFNAKEERKLRKPLIEKRRRERINCSLEQLKGIMVDAYNLDQSKLEKADVLEVTVQHMEGLQKSHGSGSPSGPNSGFESRQRYSSGYIQCMHEVHNLLLSCPGMDKPLGARLLNHLLKSLPHISSEGAGGTPAGSVIDGTPTRAMGNSNSGSVGGGSSNEDSPMSGSGTFSPPPSPPSLPSGGGATSFRPRRLQMHPSTQPSPRHTASSPLSAPRSQVHSGRVGSARLQALGFSSPPRSPTSPSSLTQPGVSYPGSQPPSFPPGIDPSMWRPW